MASPACVSSMQVCISWYRYCVENSDENAERYSSPEDKVYIRDKPCRQNQPYSGLEILRLSTCLCSKGVKQGGYKMFDCTLQQYFASLAVA